MEKKTKEKKEDMNGEQGHGRSHTRRAALTSLHRSVLTHRGRVKNKGL